MLPLVTATIIMLSTFAVYYTNPVCYKNQYYQLETPITIGSFYKYIRLFDFNILMHTFKSTIPHFEVLNVKKNYFGSIVKSSLWINSGLESISLPIVIPLFQYKSPCGLVSPMWVWLQSSYSY